MIESSIPRWTPWVFSGIGVAVIGWFGKWRHKRSRENDSPSSQENISDPKIQGPVASRDMNVGTHVHNSDPVDAKNYDAYPTSPTPFDIKSAINQASLSLRASVVESFIGIRVRWKTSLENIFPRGSNMVFVTLLSTGQGVSGPLVIAKVSVEDYPTLKTVHGGESVEAAGTIDYVEANAVIHLKDVRLKFL